MRRTVRLTVRQAEAVEKLVQDALCEIKVDEDGNYRGEWRRTLYAVQERLREAARSDPEAPQPPTSAPRSET